jgi:hypothetical protein
MMTSLRAGVVNSTTVNALASNVARGILDLDRGFIGEFLHERSPSKFGLAHRAHISAAWRREEAMKFW